MRPFRAIWFADIRRYVHDSALPYLFLRQVLDVSLKSGIGKARCRVRKSNVRHNGRGNFPVIVLWNEQENFRVIKNRRHGFTESIAAQQMGKPDSCTQCITQNLSFSFSRERPWKQSGCIANAVGVVFWRIFWMIRVLWGRSLSRSCHQKKQDRHFGVLGTSPL